MRTLSLLAMLGILGSVGACRKTGDGEYEIQKPVVGTKADTFHTPTIETGTVKDTIRVPEVRTREEEVTVPKVEVHGADNQ